VGFLDRLAADEAVFAYVAPDRWRVRHASGREIIGVGPDFWERPQAGDAWRSDRGEGGASVHHTGYLRSILLPRRMTTLADRGSRVVADERLPDGARRLSVDHVEPVSGTMVLDIGADGHVRRLAGSDDGRVVEIELSADYRTPPNPDVFDPSTPWPGPPGPDEPS
jgi:hypothetical protein